MLHCIWGSTNAPIVSSIDNSCIMFWFVYWSGPMTWYASIQVALSSLPNVVQYFLCGLLRSRLSSCNWKDRVQTRVCRVVFSSHLVHRRAWLRRCFYLAGCLFCLVAQGRCIDARFLDVGSLLFLFERSRLNWSPHVVRSYSRKSCAWSFSIMD
jgi:hypothetical protein